MNYNQEIGNKHNNNKLEHAQRQAGIWTALPGIIQSIDMEKMTCVVQPALQSIVFGQSTGTKNNNMPLLVDCPVQFPAGGQTTITFPVKKGDECLVVFSSRCIDSWWQSGGIQPQAEMRMHDLSDGFVFLGFRCVPRVIPNISTTAVQVRSDDGKAFIELNPTTYGITITTPKKVTVNCDNAEVNCDSTCNVNAGTSCTIKTPSTTIDSSQTTITGNTTIEGNLEVASNVIIGGNEIVAGNVVVGGTEIIAGDLWVGGETNV